MFSVITNIYNKKTKGPTLMEFHSHRKTEKVFFLTTRDVRCVHNGWHGTHRYDIQVVATHASNILTRVCHSRRTLWNTLYFCILKRPTCSHIMLVVWRNISYCGNQHYAIFSCHLSPLVQIFSDILNHCSSFICNIHRTWNILDDIELFRPNKIIKYVHSP